MPSGTDEKINTIGIVRDLKKRDHALFNTSPDIVADTKRFGEELRELGFEVFYMLYPTGVHKKKSIAAETIRILVDENDMTDAEFMRQVVDKDKIYLYVYSKKLRKVRFAT